MEIKKKDLIFLSKQFAFKVIEVSSGNNHLTFCRRFDQIKQGDERCARQMSFICNRNGKEGSRSGEASAGGGVWFGARMLTCMHGALALILRAAKKEDYLKQLQAET